MQKMIVLNAKIYSVLRGTSVNVTQKGGNMAKKKTVTQIKAEVERQKAENELLTLKKENEKLKKSRKG